MEKRTRQQTMADFFAALGHTRRLTILRLLARSNGPLTFEAIEAATGIKGSTLYHHLRPLRDAGLIDRKIKGRYTFYGLDAFPLRQYLRADDNTPAALLFPGRA